MKNKGCIAIALLIGVIGCSHNLEEDFAPGESNELKLVFAADSFIDGDRVPGTKTSVVPNGDYSSYQFLWSPKDTVGIYPDAGNQVYFSMAAGAGAGSAVFDGGAWTLKAGHEYRSYYPFIGEMYLDATRIPVSFTGQKQIGNTNSDHFRQCDFMYTGATTSDGGFLNFTYHHLITAVTPWVELPAGHYTGLTLSLDEPLFVTEGRYDLTAESPAIVGTAFSNTLDIELDITLASADILRAFVLLAPMDMTGHTLTITVTDEDCIEYEYTYNPSKAYVAGNIYRLQASDVTVNRTLSTNDAVSVTAFSASLGGQLSKGYHSGLTCGVCYSATTTDPTINNDTCKTANVAADGSYSVTVYGLSPSTTYYYRAFARNGNSVFYGTVKTFQTSTSDAVVITGENISVSCTALHMYGKLLINIHDVESLSYGFEIDGEVCVSSNMNDQNEFNAVQYRLQPSTSYTYRAFARINGTIYFGESVSVTTDYLADDENGIDLGFGTVWSTRNVGASSPSDVGSYFLWGEVIPVQYRYGGYDYDSYKWSVGNKLTKYCSDSSNGYYGFTDGKRSLDAEDDAAVQILGDGWRTPSSTELNKLISNCRWDLMTINGVQGYMATSKIIGYTDKCIFLPANWDDGRYGFYWSSSLYSDIRASNLWFETYESSGDPRMNYYFGLSSGCSRVEDFCIRAVKTQD